MDILQVGKILIPVLLGALLGSIIHRHHKGREKLVDTLDKFKEAFVPALRIIEKTGERTKEDFEIFITFFDSQHDAVITFRDNLTGRRRRLFDEKWREYKSLTKTYKDYDEGTRMIAIATQRGRDFHQIANEMFKIAEMHFIPLYLYPPKKKERAM